MPGLRFLLVVSSAASLSMVGVGMIVALLPQRVLDFSGSLNSVGYVASAFALSYLMVQLPVGNLADRLGAKPFLVLGYALCCLSGIVLFFAGSAEALFLGRFIQGAGEAPIWALGPALLSLAYPQAKGRVIGIYNASIHIGLAIGPLVGILLFSEGAGTVPFLVFAILCFSGGVTVVLYLPNMSTLCRGAVQHPPRLRELLTLIRIRLQLITLVGILLYGAGYGIFISVLPASLTLTKGFDHFAIGVFFALFYIAISAAQLIVGPLSDRWGRNGFMIAGTLMAAIGIATFSSFDRPWSYAPLTLASFGLGVFCVSSLAHLNDSVPESLKATISGSYFLAWGIGYFLGPLVIGLLGDVLDQQTAYVVLGLLFVIQAGALYLTSQLHTENTTDSS